MTPTDRSPRTLALVPARGGSKGIPGKNLWTIGGRSLVARAIDVARAVGEIDEVVVSSDDDEILAEAERAGGMPIERPRHLATDEVSTDSVVQHFLTSRDDLDNLLILQPTSPLRIPSDVRRCLKALDSGPAAATVSRLKHPVEWVFRLEHSGRLGPLLGWDEVISQRQEGREVYMVNGAVYAARVEFLRQGGRLVGPSTVGVIMPAERSLDIDDRLDIVFATAILEELQRENS